MYRVLCHGGRVFIGPEWNAEDGLDHTKHIEKYSMKMYTKKEVQTMMNEAGFSNISISHAKGLY
jgi:hypothetical protein